LFVEKFYPLDDNHKNDRLNIIRTKELSLWGKHYNSDVIPPYYAWLSTIKTKKNIPITKQNNKLWTTSKDILPSQTIHFSQIKSITKTQSEVFDISVPEEHSFIANGIISHNTTNLPADASVQDILDTYMKAWKLGLKSITVYRDGSKMSQPLNVMIEETEENVEEAIRSLTRALS
jgi:hypothetical protein